MSAAPITQEDLANVCKLLERLRTGEMNLIPSLVPSIESRDPTGKSEAMLQRVEALLTRELRRMNAPLDDGGPAFPRKLPEIKVSPDEAPALIKRYDGMSLRDYFAAHAPAEPQLWFQPVMPTERPTDPRFPETVTGSESEVNYVREFRDVMHINDGGIKSPELRNYIEAYKTARRAATAWDAEAMKQRFVQWPAAWADAMLKARQA